MKLLILLFLSCPVFIFAQNKPDTVSKSSDKDAKIEKGEIINIKVVRGKGSGLDEEAVRVVKMMPLWKPGKQNGQAVRVQFVLPVHFTLE